MYKRIIALLLAVMIPAALIFTGCAKERLSEKEYSDALYENFKEYAAALEEMENVQADVSSSQEKMLEQTKATEICEKAEEILERFGKLNPPKRFKEKHKMLVSAAELELKYVRAVKTVLTARTPAERAQYINEAASVFSGVPETQQLPAVLSEIAAEARDT